MYEAGRRGDRRIGTEHLLLALLADDELATIVGVDASAANEAVDGLDRTALAAVGLTLGEYRHIPLNRSARHAVSMTSGAKMVLKRSLAAAVSEKAKTITSRHMMVALLERSEPDPAATLLAELPVDREALRHRLTEAS